MDQLYSSVNTFHLFKDSRNDFGMSMFFSFLFFLHQLHPFLRSIMFNNSAGDSVSFDENGEMRVGFDITNWVTFPNGSFIRVKVGNLDLQAAQGKKLIIHDDHIVWHGTFNQVSHKVTIYEKSVTLMTSETHLKSIVLFQVSPKTASGQGYQASLSCYSFYQLKGSWGLGYIKAEEKASNIPHSHFHWWSKFVREAWCTSFSMQDFEPCW